MKQGNRFVCIIVALMLLLCAYTLSIRAWWIRS